MQQSRNLTQDLHPPVLESFGLGSALQNAAVELGRATGLDVRVRADREPSPETPETRDYLFRAAKELMTNAAKHARARRLTIDLASKGDNLVLQVSDDGKGIDTREALDARGENEGIGLFSIQERIASFGGSFEIESAPGRGTSVRLRVPLGKRETDR
jgi:signal transduction histidine kinase